MIADCRLIPKRKHSLAQKLFAFFLLTFFFQTDGHRYDLDIGLAHSYPHPIPPPKKKTILRICRGKMQTGTTPIFK